MVRFPSATTTWLYLVDFMRSGGWTCLLGTLSRHHSIARPPPHWSKSSSRGFIPSTAVILSLRGDPMEGDREITFHSEAYRRMLTIRRFEETAYSLYKNGEILGALHLSIGQEASAVGACLALQPNDYVTGTHRCHGHLIASGASLRGMMAELFGKRTGVAKGKGGHMHLVDVSAGYLGSCGIVGSNLPVAVGVAMALRQENRANVCLVFSGDGAAQQGAWHESLNLASLWKLPVVFLCENNGWAQDTPQAKETLASRYSDRAAAYGIPAQTVDGQVFTEVFRAVDAAVSAARRGLGPGFVAAMTY